MTNALPASAAALPSFGAVLLRLWPNGDEKIPGLRAGMIASAPAVFGRFGIDTPLLVAHVMAQFSEECGAGHDVVENGNYTAVRITEVWPHRFPTIESARPYAGNPKALFSNVYGGRMGNRPGTDDGYNFRGRGGSQCTGREGYERLAKATGLDLVNNPALINTPENFLLCAVADFVACGCLPYAKADDVENVTKHLNGGYIGLAERKVWLARWKVALGSAPIVLVPAPRPADPKPSPTGQKPPSPTPAPKPAPAPQGFFAMLAALFAAIFKRKG